MINPPFSEEHLTAYALGELSPAERREMEAALENDPHLREELASIQTLATELREEFLAEMPELDSAEPVRIPENRPFPPKAESDKIISFRKNPWLYGTGLLAAAACAALLAIPVISLPVQTTQKRSNPVATLTERSKEETISVSTMFAESAPAPDEPAPMPVTESVLDESVSVDASTGVPLAQNNIVSAPQASLALEQTTLGGYAPGTVVATRSMQSTFGVQAESFSDASASPSQGQARRRPSPASGEFYDQITDNPFQRVAEAPLSTFSVDVDTAAYSNLRRFLNDNQLPPKNAVRIEELINYFSYNYPQPSGTDPFSVTTEVANAPWNNEHLLLRIGLQGKTIAADKRPPANLVFLIDVSGSMNQPNKLPLVVESMKLFVEKLKPTDRVGIAVYAGNSGMVLPSTSLTERGKIVEALSELQAGGSTNGAMGIQLAYDMAKAHFIEGGINRVILCTDGDFNVGVTSREGLIQLIEEKAKSKVFLSVFGFGMGNLKDSTLEQLSDKGNGTYGYIDNRKEAKRVFIDKIDGTLQTIAKDVKIQVEFNPAVVGSYRLIGYENRMLAARDFDDDKKDAGEIGSGHRVTALYELVPVGAKDEASVDSLKYQKPAPVDYAGDKSEIMNVKLRYKEPEGDRSKLIEQAVRNGDIRSFATHKAGWFRSSPGEASADFQFAAGVASFGMMLRESPYQGKNSFDLALRLAEKGTADKQPERLEFLGLIKKARMLRQANARTGTE